jgi:cellobiose phosphorylase
VEKYADPRKVTNISEFVSSFTETMAGLGPEYQTGGQGTILEHCYRGIEKVWRDRSARNIPLMLGGDWNDDLNECGRLGKGESVQVAAQLALSLRCMIEILEYAKRDSQKAASYKEIYAILKEATNKECWDGEWYWRFTRDDGRVEGSHVNKEGSMYLEPQPWAVIGGIAEGDRAVKCLDSVLEHLDTDYGPVICAPEYTISDATIGAATREAPGKKENASVFNHPVTWFIQANTILGRGTIAYQQYYKTLPAVLSKDQDRFAVEPYVYPEYTTGPAHTEYGKGGHSWLTGTAPWMFFCGVEFILGVKPAFDGLIIQPCIPATWKGYEITRKFRGATYTITVKNPDHVECRVTRVTVDGREIAGNKVPAFTDGREHVVEVVM